MYLSVNSIFQKSFPFPTIILGMWIGIGIPVILSAATPAITSTPAIPLEQVQEVLIETLALTERGLQDSTAILQSSSVNAWLRQASLRSTTSIPPTISLCGSNAKNGRTRTGPSKHRKRQSSPIDGFSALEGPSLPYFLSEPGQTLPLEPGKCARRLKNPGKPPKPQGPPIAACMPCKSYRSNSHRMNSPCTWQLNGARPIV